MSTPRDVGGSPPGSSVAGADLAEQRVRDHSRIAARRALAHARAQNCRCSAMRRSVGREPHDLRRRAIVESSRDGARDDRDAHALVANPRGEREQTADGWLMVRVPTIAGGARAGDPDGANLDRGIHDANRPSITRGALFTVPHATHANGFTLGSRVRSRSARRARWVRRASSRPRVFSIGRAADSAGARCR